MSVDLLGPANAPGAVTVRPTDGRVFGATDTWYKDCTNPDANDGTEITAAAQNAILAQIRNAVRGMGAVLDNTSDDMLLHAVQLAMSTYAADTGVADVAVISHSPAWASYGTRIFAVMWKFTNATPTPTINVDGLGAKPLIHHSSRQLHVGELQANRCDICIYDGASVRVVTPTLPGFNTMLVWQVAGSYGWTAPAGVTKVRARGRGAGGGGGSSDGVYSGGAGGEGGEFEGYFDVVPGTLYSLVIGVKGIGAAAGSMSNGATGGTTAFGPFATATGGTGGGPALGGAAAGGGNGGNAAGGQRNRNGQLGQSSNGNANSNYPMGGGEGGNDNFGSAVAPGSGGSGGNISIAAGNGADGEIVLEFAA